MAGAREVKVRLVADTTEYEGAMRRAAKRARKLAKAMRELDGIAVHVSVERESS